MSYTIDRTVDGRGGRRRAVGPVALRSLVENPALEPVGLVLRERFDRIRSRIRATRRVTSPFRVRRVVVSKMHNVDVPGSTVSGSSGSDVAGACADTADIDTGAEGVAESVLLSYRATEVGEDGTGGEWILQDNGWILENIRTDAYRQYVRRAHEGQVAVGEEWDEFVTCGCASPTDVVLRIEAMDGGSEIGSGTDIEFVPRRDVLEDSTPTST